MNKLIRYVYNVLRDKLYNLQSFSKYPDPQNTQKAYNFIKKRLHYRCFPVNLKKSLKTPVLKNICERLLLYVLVVLAWYSRIKMHQRIKYFCHTIPFTISSCSILEESIGIVLAVIDIYKSKSREITISSE